MNITLPPAGARSPTVLNKFREVPLFFKQVGGRTPKAGGRLLGGRTWDEYPDSPTAGELTA